MADVNVKVYRIDMTDWHGVRRTQTQFPQNWSVKKHGELNPENYRKFLEAQWKGNGAIIHSITEVDAVVDPEAFTPEARTTAAAKPRVVEKA